MIRHSELVAFLCLLVASPSWAAPTTYWQADTKVKSVVVDESPDTWLCHATVHNHWDDDAWHVQAMVLLPVGVHYIASGTTAGSCTANVPTAGSTNSYVTCDLGNLGVQATEEFKVLTTAPPRAVRDRRCGVFVKSETPDPDRSNNYRLSP